jgi:hypothetical protein
MTQEEQDAIVGKVIRESKAADAEVRALVAKAHQVADRIETAGSALKARIRSAELATGLVEEPPTAYRQLPKDQPMPPQALTNYPTEDAVRQLDADITAAVNRSAHLREQRKGFGV